MMQKLSQRAQAIQPSATLETSTRVRQLKAQGVDIINLSIGQPDFPTPTAIRTAATVAIEENEVNGYTDTAGIPPLRQAVADLYQHQNVTVTADQVVVASGAKTALYALFQAIIDPGDEVLLPAPYWVSYQEQVRLANGHAVDVEPNADLKVTPTELEQVVTAKTKALVLNSPQNPSGVVYTPAELKAIGDWAVAHDLWIVSDEIYGHLVYDQPAPEPTMLTLGADVAAHTIVINGVSKTYAMTGWRIGYAVAPRNIAKAMTQLLAHMTGNPAAVSQVAALAALSGEQDSVVQMRNSFKDRRDRLYAELQKVPGFKLAYKPAGAFYLFPDVSEAMAMKHCATSQELVNEILDQAHVAVVAGEAFGLANHLRLSYATSQAELTKAVERLMTFMQSN